MVAFVKQQQPKVLLLAGLLIAYSCSGQYGTGKLTVAKHTATAYITTTAQLRSDYLPDSVFQLRGLRSLIIKGSDCDFMQRDENGKVIKNCWMLRELPSAIKNLSQLEELRLPVNSLSALPAELATLRQLRLLDLSDNAGLTNINSIITLVQLRELYLGGCYLEKLPPEIGNLKNLRTLCLTGNTVSPVEQARIRRALPNCAVFF